jgi:hypothetical protein
MYLLASTWGKITPQAVSYWFRVVPQMSYLIQTTKIV